jgi:3-dehydroquinate synthase class II
MSSCCHNLVADAAVQMLVEARTPDGALHSTLLQNAETVRLVGPAQQQPQQQQQQQQQKERPPPTADRVSQSTQMRAAAAVPGVSAPGWVALPVSELAPGNVVYVLQQEGARHTGISIQERIVEK